MIGSVLRCPAWHDNRDRRGLRGYNARVDLFQSEGP